MRARSQDVEYNARGRISSAREAIKRVANYPNALRLVVSTVGSVSRETADSRCLVRALKLSSGLISLDTRIFQTLSFKEFLLLLCEKQQQKVNISKILF